MFPYNIVEQQGAELLQRCAEKNIGFIDMKPLAGGAIEDATLALRYVCSNPDVTVVIPGMAEVHELDENIKACSNANHLPKRNWLRWTRFVNSLVTISAVAAIIVHLVQSVSIFRASFLFAGYLQRYDLADWAKDRYRTLPVKASACIECGKCEPRCPYHLPIREKLKQCAKDMGE